MNIICNGIRSYMFCCVAMAGQVAKSMLQENPHTTPAYTAKIIKELIDEKVLIEKKIEGTKMIRLRAPLGLEILSHIPALEMQYMKVSNKHHFQTNPKSMVVRSKNTGDMIVSAIYAGIRINDIEITFVEGKPEIIIPEGSIIKELYLNYKTIVKKNGAIKTEDAKEKSLIKILKGIEIYKEVEIAETANYNSKVFAAQKKTGNIFISTEVKRYYSNNKISSTLRINSSRMYGHALSENGSCIIYYIPGSKYTFNFESERQVKGFVENLDKSMLGRVKMEHIKQNSPNGKCIFLYNNEKEIAAYFNDVVTNNAISNTPIRLYSNCYAVNVKDYEQLRELVTLSKIDLNEGKAFTINEIQSAAEAGVTWCEAIIDSKPALSLVYVDLNKVFSVMNILKKSKEIKIIIITKRKQLPILKELFKTYTNQIEYKIIENYRTISG